jgi:hypothetical protein
VGCGCHSNRRATCGIAGLGERRHQQLAGRNEPRQITEAQIDEMFDKLSLALDDTLDHVTRLGLLAA